MKRAIAAALLISVLTAPAVAGPNEDVLYRKTLMHTAGMNAQLLRAIGEGRLDRAGDFDFLAQQLAANAGRLEAAFKVNTSGTQTQVPTESKPEVWTKWPDFKKKLDAYVAGAKEVAVLSKAGKRDDALKVLKDKVVSACKGCHDDFKKD